MNERDFEIGARKFKLSKIDTFKQFYILKRLGPILGEVIPAAQKIASMNRESMSQAEQLEVAGQLATPVMHGLSKLSDADAQFVLLGLCSAAEMSQASGGWARVVVNEQLMFQDLDLPTLFQIAGRAFAYNMASFFASAPQVSHGGA